MLRLKPALRAGAGLLWLGALPAAAGTRPQVDLSLSAVMTPATFSPGGRTTVALTLHNGGPSAAGTIPGTTPSLYAYMDHFIVTHQPPPFEVVPPVSGCGFERFLTEPLPDGNIALIFTFYFDAIPAGQSRSCVFDIVFGASTTANVPSGFTTYTSNDMDVKPANDRLDYLFVMAPATPVPVPLLSTPARLALTMALLLPALYLLRRRAHSHSRKPRQTRAFRMP